MATQFNSDDLAALELLLSKYKAPRGGRRWMVSQSTGTGGAPGTFSQPLDTFTEALSNAASAGDQIYILDGTFHGSQDCSSKTLDILGSSVAAVTFTHNGNDANGVTLQVTHSSSVRHVTINATGTSHQDTAFSCGGAYYVTVEDCNINGKYDALICVSSFGFVGRRLLITGTYDSIQVGDSQAFLLEDVVASVDGSWNSGNESSRALVGQAPAMGVCRRCSFTSTKSNTGSGDTPAIEFNGILTLEDCTVAASASNVSYTHDVYGITEKSSSGDAEPTCRIKLVRTNILTSTVGSGRAWDLATASGYVMDAGGSYFNKQKVTGNNIVSDPFEIDKLIRVGNIG